MVILIYQDFSWNCGSLYDLHIFSHDFFVKSSTWRWIQVTLAVVSIKPPKIGWDSWRGVFVATCAMIQVDKMIQVAKKLIRLPFGCRKKKHRALEVDARTSWLGFWVSLITRSICFPVFGKHHTTKTPGSYYVPFKAPNKKTCITTPQKGWMDGCKQSTTPNYGQASCRSAWTPMILSMSRRIAFGCGRRLQNPPVKGMDGLIWVTLQRSPMDIYILYFFFVGGRFY